MVVQSRNLALAVDCGTDWTF